MKLSNIFDKIREKFAWERSKIPDERFYYFFWDLVHYHKGITNRYTRPKFLDSNKNELEVNKDDIVDALEEAIREFSLRLMKINSKLSHPINLNNINRYGWEWIMGYAKLIIFRDYSGEYEQTNKKIENHKNSLSGIFKDPTRIGYKGKLR